jgi:inorganic pyrophosphatase/exopolyphosphatase
MKIISAGGSWMDIDVVGCGVAYEEFIGPDAKLILQGEFNATVPNTVRSMLPPMTNTYEPCEDDEFILVDISNPEYFSDFVKENKIIEVWDHRRGFEDYWMARIGKHNIELVGACATLIWEKFEATQKPISTLSANLLYTAIISNTLNLSSKNTTPRDRQAVKRLEGFIDLPDKWIEQYYKESEEYILQDPITAINNDTKEVNLRGESVGIAQLEFWSIDDFLKIDGIEDLLQRALGKYKKWFLTAPCIRDRQNYFITPFPEVQKLLADRLHVVFNGNIGRNDHVLLRKEIIHLINEDDKTQNQPS